MKTLLDAAKELSMGEITYTEFSEIICENPAEMGKVISNYHYELMKTWKTQELEASLNNLGYLIEQYSGEENK